MATTRVTTSPANPPSHPEIRMIDPLHIHVVPEARRALVPEAIERLRESISAIGQIAPIAVREADTSKGNGPPYELLAGYHRLEVMRGTGQIAAIIYPPHTSPATARAIEREENYARADLSPEERAEWFAERVDALLAAAEQAPTRGEITPSVTEVVTEALTTTGRGRNKATVSRVLKEGKAEIGVSGSLLGVSATSAKGRKIIAATKEIVTDSIKKSKGKSVTSKAANKKQYRDNTSKAIKKAMKGTAAATPAVTGDSEIIEQIKVKPANFIGIEALVQHVLNGLKLLGRRITTGNGTVETHISDAVASMEDNDRATAFLASAKAVQHTCVDRVALMRDYILALSSEERGELGSQLHAATPGSVHELAASLTGSEADLGEDTY